MWLITKTTDKICYQFYIPEQLEKYLREEAMRNWKLYGFNSYRRGFYGEIIEKHVKKGLKVISMAGKEINVAEIIRDFLKKLSKKYKYDFKSLFEQYETIKLHRKQVEAVTGIGELRMLRAIGFIRKDSENRLFYVLKKKKVEMKKTLCYLPRKLVEKLEIIRHRKYNGNRSLMMYNLILLGVRFLSKKVMELIKALRVLKGKTMKRDTFIKFISKITGVSEKSSRIYFYINTLNLLRIIRVGKNYFEIV